jgi:hypothetical protein
LTLKTKFKTTPSLLSEREALHELADCFWRYGQYTRNQVYAMLSRSLGSAAVLHISDLDHDQLRIAADAFMQLLETDELAACRTCKHKGSEDSLGIPICSLCGRPFCVQSTNILQRCSNYERRTETTEQVVTDR